MCKYKTGANYFCLRMIIMVVKRRVYLAPCHSYEYRRKGERVDLLGAKRGGLLCGPCCLRGTDGGAMERGW